MMDLLNCRLPSFAVELDSLHEMHIFTNDFDLCNKYIGCFFLLKIIVPLLQLCFTTTPCICITFFLKNEILPDFEREKSLAKLIPPK